MGEQEYFFRCPYCREKISMLLDTSASQNYIEDCEVCCRPIQIQFSAEDDQIKEFSAERIL